MNISYSSSVAPTIFAQYSHVTSTLNPLGFVSNPPSKIFHISYSSYPFPAGMLYTSKMYSSSVSGILLAAIAISYKLGEYPSSILNT